MPWFHKLRYVAALASISVLFGCTSTLISEKVSQKKPANGPSYFLPMLQYKVKVSMQLKSCPVREFGVLKNETTLTGENEDRVYAPKFETQFEATPTYVPDPGTEHFIDYTELYTASKSGKLAIEYYPGQILKSFNVSLKDHGPEIAQEAIKTGFTVARMAVGPSLYLPPVALMALEPTKEQLAKQVLEPIKGVSCSDEARNLDQARADTNDQVKKYLHKLSDLLDKVAAAKRILEAENSETNVKALIKAENDVEVLRKTLAKTRKKLANLENQLSFSWSEVWPRQGKPLHGRLDVPPHLLLPMIAPEEYQIPEGHFFIETTRNKFLNSIGLSLELSPYVKQECVSSSTGTKPDAAQTDGATENASTDDTASKGKNDDMKCPSTDLHAGLKYRTPRLGTFAVCHDRVKKDGTVIDGCSGAKEATVLTRNEVAIPQLGVLGSLPLQNRFAQENVLEVVFLPNGAPSSVEYVEQGSRAARSAALLSAAAHQAEQFKQLKASEPLLELDNQIAVTEKQIKLRLLEIQLKELEQSASDE